MTLEVSVWLFVFTEILENMGLELYVSKRNNYWVFERGMAKFSCIFREKFPLTFCLIKLEISGSLFRFCRVFRKRPIPTNSSKRCSAQRGMAKFKFYHFEFVKIALFSVILITSTSPVPAAGFLD